MRELVNLSVIIANVCVLLNQTAMKMNTKYAI